MIYNKDYDKHLHIRVNDRNIEQLNELCEWLGYEKSWLVRELINRFYVEVSERLENLKDVDK